MRMRMMNPHGSVVCAVLCFAWILGFSRAEDVEIKPLKRNTRDCSIANPCGQCEGDCDNDGDCEGDLICFNKGKGPDDDPFYVPSCKGIDTSRTDWCVVDLRVGSLNVSGGPSKRLKKVRDCTNGGACQECEGHCAGDNECAGNLVCYDKQGGTSVPGCDGVDNSKTDWCVRPEIVENGGDGGTPLSVKNGELMVLAYYYSWYYEGDWSRHGLQGNKPQLGFYGTDSPAIAEQHNEWASDAGIDTWVVSWWGQDRVSDDHFFKGMLRARNLNKMKFCMLYEHGALVTNDFSDGTRAIDGMVKDLKYFRDNFFNHPQYLYVNDKPMVVLYLTRNYLNFQPRMVDEIQRRVGVEMFFVADTPYFGRNNNPFTGSNGIVNGKPVFESYTSYNMYTDPSVRDGESATEYMFREALPIYKRWAEHTTYFPQVLPMYHDFRDHPPLVGDAAGMRVQLEEFACLNKPQGDKYPNMMFMTSWNEWWEGSQLEPDEAGKYGFMFLDELKKFKDAGPAKC